MSRIVQDSQGQKFNLEEGYPLPEGYQFVDVPSYGQQFLQGLGGPVGDIGRIASGQDFTGGARRLLGFPAAMAGALPDIANLISSGIEQVGGLSPAPRLTGTEDYERMLGVPEAKTTAERLQTRIPEFAGAFMVPGFGGGGSVGELATTALRAAPGAAVGGEIGGRLTGGPFGQAIGELAGGFASILSTSLAQPLREILTHPGVKQKVDTLASLKHESPDTVIARNQTVADLNAELAQHQQPPVDVVEISQPSLLEQATKAIRPSQPPPTEAETSTSNLLRLAQKSQTEREQFPWERSADDLLAQRKLGEDLFGSSSPSWVQQNIHALAGAVRPEIADKIEELASQRLTAREISKILSLPKEQVIAVRSIRGIPSMDFTSEFETWLTSKKPSSPTIEPQEAEAYKKVLEKAKTTHKRDVAEGRGSIVNGVHLDPDGTFGDDPAMKSFLARMWKYRHMPGIYGRAFIQNMRPADDLLADDVVTRDINSQWRTLDSDLAEEFRRMRLDSQKEIVKDLKLKKFEDFELLANVIEDTKTQPDGTIKVLTPSTDPKINKAAKTFRKRLDKAYTIMSGVDAQAGAILREAGLHLNRKGVEDPKAWQRGLETLKSIQDDLSSIISGPTDPRLVYLAEKTKGMLNFTRNHDTTLIYDGDHFSMSPVRNEEAYLRDNIREFEERSTMGWDQAKLDRWKLALDDAKQQLNAFIKKAEAKKNKGLPITGVIPKRSYLGPADMAANPDAAKFEFARNTEEYLGRLFDSYFNKRSRDFLLGESRIRMNEIANNSQREYLKTHIDTQLGKEQLRNDQWVSNVAEWANEKGIHVTVKDIDKATGNLMKFHVFAKVLLRAPFYYFHGSQSLTSVWGVVGDRAYRQAIADLVNPQIWKNLLARGVLEDRVGAFSGVEQGKIMNVVGWPAAKQRLGNKFIAYQGTIHALEEPGSLTRLRIMLPSAYIPPGMSSVSRETASQIAKAGIREMIHDYGKAEAPHIISGSRVGKLTFQLSQYGLRYATLLKNAGKLAIKEKDVGVFARMIAAIWLVGGIPAVAGFATPFAVLQGERAWPWIQKHYLKLTGHLLPDRSGFSYIMQAIGLGFHSPVDINEHMNPIIHLGGQFLYPFGFLGPSFSLPTVPFVAASRGGISTPSGARTYLSAISPTIPQIGRAIFEEKATPGRRLALAVGLTKSAQQLKYENKELFKVAVESGIPGATKEVIEKSKEEGQPLSLKDMMNVRRRLTGEARRRYKTVGEVFTK